MSKEIPYDDNWGKMYIGGFSVKDIALKYNISDEPIRLKLKKHGIKIRTKKEASDLAVKNGKIGGNGLGYFLDGNGYEMCSRVGNNYRKQIHRIIIEKHIGRELYNDEVVHHINGNKRNNHVGNLQVMKRGDHIALHNKLNPRRITKRNKFGQIVMVE